MSGGLTRAELGRIGERTAALWLEERGWTIRERNARVGRDEIDLVAENGGILCFVEVKTRRQFPDYRTPEGTPAEAVDARKQAAMIRAAEAWLASHPGDAEKTPRLDVMEVYADPGDDGFRLLLIRHLPGAVRKTAKFSPRSPRNRW